MDEETKEVIADLANALVISFGVLVVELEKTGAVSRVAVSDHLKRRVFEAEETGAEPGRKDLLWLRLMANALRGDLE